MFRMSWLLFFFLTEEWASGCFVGEKTAQSWAAYSHPEGCTVREGKRWSSRASRAHQINGCSLHGSSKNMCPKGSSLHLIGSIDLIVSLSGQYICLVCFDQIYLNETGWGFACMHLLWFEIGLHDVTNVSACKLEIIRKWKIETLS